MWSKLTSLRWIQYVRARTCGGAKGRTIRRPRLGVEGLEDRSVPAVLGASTDPVTTAARLAFYGPTGQRDGPLAPAGYDLAYLYSQYLSFTAAGGSPGAFRPVDSLLQVSGGRVLVDVLPTGTAAAVQADLGPLGFVPIAGSAWDVSGALPITSLAAAAALPGVRAIEPDYRPVTSAGAVTSQGVQAVRSNLVTQYLGLDGTGTTVGVLSDSYNVLNGAAADVASGDLPGPANPNGHTTPVNVVADAATGTDEGRAMLQIVHDVAPGAHLAFATAGTTQAQFASNIRALAAAGADVIVDDFTFLTEPMFQDGLVAQAVNQVEAAGISYFSAAGNLGRGSYQQGFANSGVNLGTAPGGLGKVPQATFIAHNFDTTGGTDLYQTVTLPPGTTTFSFQWADPFFSVSGAPGAATELDVAVFDTAGNFTNVGGFTRTTGADPVQVFSVTNPNAAPMQVKIAIGKVSGPDPALMKYVAFVPIAGETGFSIDTHATNSGTIFGHANTTGAVAVGAALYSETPAFGQSPPLLEPYSSRGGTPVLYDTTGHLLPAPQTRQTPGVVAPDGVNTTFFGQPDPVGTGRVEADGFPNFFGTSAAAPHAAGVAALLLQAKPALKTNPAAVYAALETTALPMGTPSPNRDSGWGLIQAPAAVAAVGGTYAVTFTGTVGDDAMLIRRDTSGTHIQFLLGGVLQFELPVPQVTSITVLGLGGNDTLTVDNSNGVIGVPIGYDGGGGTNALVVAGTPFPIQVSGTAGSATLTAAVGGSPPISFTAVQAVTLAGAGGTVDLAGAAAAGPADTFVVRGTGPGAFTETIDGGPAIRFAGVTALNVSAGAPPATLDLTPWASNSPAGWGVQTYFAGSGPTGTDLLVVHAVSANPVSEAIAVQPGAGNGGEVRATNAVDGSLIAVVSYLNTDLSVDDTTASPTATDTLTIGGAVMAEDFVIDLSAAGTAAAPMVDVRAGGFGGPSLYRVRSITGFPTIGITALGGADTVQLVAGRADGGVSLDVHLGSPASGSRIELDGTGGGGDVFRYTPGSTPDSGRLLVTRSGAVAPTRVDFAGPSAVAFNGGSPPTTGPTAGSDQIILDGTPGADGFSLAGTAPFAGTAQVNAGPRISFSALGSTASTITLNGLGGADSFVTSVPAGWGIGGVTVNGVGAAIFAVTGPTGGNNLFTYTPSAGFLAVGTQGGPAVPFTFSGVGLVAVDAPGPVATGRLVVTDAVPVRPTPGGGRIPSAPPLSYQGIASFAIGQVPAAGPTTATTPEGAPVTIDVLATATGIGDAPLTLTITSPPAHGTAEVVGTTVVYTPDPGYADTGGGPDTFSYTVTDVNGESSTAAVTVHVTPVNFPPVAAPQTVSTGVNLSTAIALTASPGGQEPVPILTYAIVTGPAHGTLTGFDPATGRATYTPAPGYSGPDGFTFTATDVTVGPAPPQTGAPAAVTIRVLAPVATADTYTVAAGGTLSRGAAAGVLGNDTDPDGDPLTATLVTGPAHGTLALAPDGSFGYTPYPGFSGPDAFVYQAADARGGTATATVTIAVTPPTNPIIVTGAGAGGGPHVEVFDAQTGALMFSFFAYDPAYTGGVRVAVGDVNGDGAPDIITSTGPGGGPNIKVFSGKDLSLLASFFAFEPTFTGGATVAVGHFDGQPGAEIVVGAGPGAGPRVETFRIVAGRAVPLAGPLGSFFAFEPTFTGGVNVAAGNLTGGPTDEIVVGAASLGGPHVVVFDATGTQVESFFAFAAPELGVTVAVADLTGTGKAQIITGPGAGGGPVVQVFDGVSAAQLNAFPVYIPSFRGGVTVAAVDRNGDGKADLIVGPGQQATALQIFDGSTLSPVDQFDPFDPTFSGGVYVAGSV
ncbi:MAG: hypothetical protein JWO38_2382 [Gemmataceae bacterium]|nr:hypothetical protein [Gemmataceae bacterium]